MSTTSSVITIAICAVLIIALGFAIVKGLWSAAKKITIPIQIVLFVVLLTCVVRLFCTKENAQKLYKGIEQTGISQSVESTMRTALNLKPGEAANSEAPTVEKTPGSDTPVEKQSAAAPRAEAVPVMAPQPIVSAPQPVVAAPQPVVAVSQPVAGSAPSSVKAPDYSHLDKGKKTFTYALPFNAKATVGFKDNTYRVIVESFGQLSASEKKEVGKLIMASLGEYVGRSIAHSDKSKISIESRYDEADNHTHVFAIIPPDAIEE